MTRAIAVSTVDVIEGNVYEVWGEDSKLVVYDCLVQAICDGDIYLHNHTFKGTVEDREGFAHPNFHAKEDAERLANRVADHGFINLDHWVSAGHVDELEDPLERLERSWSDTSDHYC